MSSRRHLAFISATVMEGLSSTRISVWLRAADAIASLVHSSSVSLPVASFWLSTKLSPARRRMASCSRDISREKKATVWRYFLATFRAMFRANDVLPIAGRAAIRSRSDRLRPLIFRSRSTRPVERPGMSLSDWANSVRRSNTLCSTKLMGSRLSPRSPLRRA